MKRNCTALSRVQASKTSRRLVRCVAWLHLPCAQHYFTHEAVEFGELQLLVC